MPGKNESMLSFRHLTEISEPDGPTASSNWKSIVDRDEQLVIFLQLWSTMSTVPRVCSNSSEFNVCDRITFNHYPFLASSMTIARIILSSIILLAEHIWKRSMISVSYWMPWMVGGVQNLQKGISDGARTRWNWGRIRWWISSIQRN